MSTDEHCLRERANRCGWAYAELAGVVEILTRMGLGTDHHGVKLPPEKALQRIADRFAEIDARTWDRRADR